MTVMMIAPRLMMMLIAVIVLKKWCSDDKDEEYDDNLVFLYVYILLFHVLQLAREAVQVRSQIPHIVLGNQIISHVSW